MEQVPPQVFKHTHLNTDECPNGSNFATEIYSKITQ